MAPMKKTIEAKIFYGYVKFYLGLFRGLANLGGLGFARAQRDFKDIANMLLRYSIDCSSKSL